MDSEGVRKVCFKCKHEKPLSDFYKHRKMKDGHLNKCKECTKNDVGAHREANIETIREYDRERSKLPHRVKVNTERTKNYRKMNPSKARAHRVVSKAVSSGRLQKTPCVVCGDERRVEAHHPDYTRPLDVIFLCSVHHHAVHHRGLKVTT